MGTEGSGTAKEAMGGGRSAAIAGVGLISAPALVDRKARAGDDISGRGGGGRAAMTAEVRLDGWEREGMEVKTEVGE